jgi:hypothetical protein
MTGYFMIDPPCTLYLYRLVAVASPQSTTQNLPAPLYPALPDLLFPPLIKAHAVLSHDAETALLDIVSATIRKRKVTIRSMPPAFRSGVSGCNVCAVLVTLALLTFVFLPFTANTASSPVRKRG